MATNTLAATLLAMAGQRNIITVPRAFVQFTESLEAAMMLNQLLYWMPRAHGEAVYKADSEWMDELCLTRYAVRKARECLEKMGFLRTEVHHVRGAPAVHYHIDYDVLVDRWTLWLQEHGIKSENELYSAESKVRKRTLPHESSSNSNGVKFENGRTIKQRVPTVDHVGDGDRARMQKRAEPKGGIVPPTNDGRTLAFLIDEAVGAAEEFAHLPYEPTRADYQARREDGQTKASIVRAWRSKPPTETYHYGQKRTAERAPLAPTRPNVPDRTATPAEVLRQARRHNDTPS